GVSLGRLSEETLLEIHRKMGAEIRRAGAALDAVYYCPHDNDCCDCRKPRSGLFLRAQRDFPEISWQDSFVIGDSVSDMEAAERLACRKILIGTDPGVTAALERARIRVDY